MELTEIRDRLKQAMDLIEPIPDAMVPLIYHHITTAYNELDNACVSVAGDVKWRERMADKWHAWGVAKAKGDDDGKE